MVEMKEAEKLSYINFSGCQIDWLIDWLIITVSAEGSTKLLT